MAGATLALFLTDFAYSISVRAPSTTTGVLEAGWATFYVERAVARVDASAVGAHPGRRPEVDGGRLWLLALASLLAPSVMMIQHLRHEADLRDLPVLIGASAALFLLVV